MSVQQDSPEEVTQLVEEANVVRKGYVCCSVVWYRLNSLLQLSSFAGVMEETLDLLTVVTFSCPDGSVQNRYR